jgi:hypothetical protein
LSNPRPFSTWNELRSFPGGQAALLHLGRQVGRRVGAAAAAAAATATATATLLCRRQVGVRDEVGRVKARRVAGVQAEGGRQARALAGEALGGGQARVYGRGIEFGPARGQ